MATATTILLADKKFSNNKHSIGKMRNAHASIRVTMKKGAWIVKGVR